LCVGVGGYRNHAARPGEAGYASLHQNTVQQHAVTQFSPLATHINGTVITEQRNHDSVHSRPLGSHGHGAARTDGTGRAVFLSLRPRPLSRGRRRAVAPRWLRRSRLGSGHGGGHWGPWDPWGMRRPILEMFHRAERSTAAAADRKPRRRSWAPVLVPDGGSRPGPGPPGCTGKVEC
jgi:hypothetical protein